jgi:hypothetical protein
MPYGMVNITASSVDCWFVFLTGVRPQVYVGAASGCASIQVYVGVQVTS